MLTVLVQFIHFIHKEGLDDTLGLPGHTSHLRTNFRWHPESDFRFCFAYGRKTPQRQLEAEGWIVTVPGKGCFVSGIPQYALDKHDDLLTAFDRAVAALLQNGTTREELITRLQKEGNSP